MEDSTMGTIGDKFYINVKANSPRELDKRIKDNEKRGFKVYKVDEPRVNTFRDVNYNVDGHGRTQYGRITKEHHISHSVVMVRESQVGGFK